MKPIVWTEQNEFFGLDYSSKKGIFHDYEFDIRYDYEGNPKIKPYYCGIFLTIFKNNSKVGSKYGHSIETLVRYSEIYLENEKQKFLK
jgi:hypothetical protein